MVIKRFGRSRRQIENVADHDQNDLGRSCSEEMHYGQRQAAHGQRYADNGTSPSAMASVMVAMTSNRLKMNTNSIYI